MIAKVKSPFKGKPLDSFKDVKAGQKFIIRLNQGSHNYPLNKILTFKKNGIASNQMADCAVEIIGGNTLMAYEVELTSLTLTQLKENLQELTDNYNKESEEIKNKIDICEKLGIEEYDDTFLTIYNELEKSGKKVSTLDLAKSIMSAIS